MHVFLFNVGCIVHHETLSFSAHVTTTSETFYFKMADAIAMFFKASVMKINSHCIKVCKKKNLTCMSGMDRQICPLGHSLASLGEPRDAKL